MTEVEDQSDWRQTEHRIRRAEILCVAALVVLTVLTIAAGLSNVVR
jgi:hypothetical protein